MKRVSTVLFVAMVAVTAPAVAMPAGTYTKLAPPFGSAASGTLCSSGIAQGVCADGDTSLAASGTAAKNGSGSVSAFAEFGTAQGRAVYATRQTLGAAVTAIDYRYVIKVTGAALASPTGSADVSVAIDIQHSCACFSYQETQILVPSGADVSGVTYTKDFIVTNTSIFGADPIPAGDLVVALYVLADASNSAPGSSSSARGTFAIRSLAYKLI